MVNVIKKYINYLRDNPQGYWFKRRLIGWGWTPAKWQGWLFLAIWLCSVFYTTFLVESNFATEEEKAFALLPAMGLLIAMLIMVAYGTGEKPKWSFGK